MSTDLMSSHAALPNFHRQTVVPNPCSSLGPELVKKHQAALSTQLESIKKNAAKYAVKSSANPKLLQEVYSLSAFLQEYLDSSSALWALLHSKMDDYLQDSLPQIQSDAALFSRQFTEYVVNVHSAIDSNASLLLFLKSAADSPQALEQSKMRLQDMCVDATFRSFSPSLMQAAILHTLTGQLTQFYSSYLSGLLDSITSAFTEKIDIFSKLLASKATDDSGIHLELASVAKLQKDLYNALKPITVSSENAASIIEKVHSSAHHITSSTSLNNLSISTASLSKAASPQSPVTHLNPLNSSGTHIVPMRGVSMGPNSATAQQWANNLATSMSAPPQLPPKPTNSNRNSVEDIGKASLDEKPKPSTLEPISSVTSMSSEGQASGEKAGRVLSSVTKSRPSNRKGRRRGTLTGQSSSPTLPQADEDGYAGAEHEVVDLSDEKALANLPKSESFSSAQSAGSGEYESESMEKQIKKKRPVTLAAGGALAALAGIMSQGLRSRQNQSQENIKIASDSSSAPQTNATEVKEAPKAAEPAKLTSVVEVVKAMTEPLKATADSQKPKVMVDSSKAQSSVKDSSMQQSSGAALSKNFLKADRTAVADTAEKDASLLVSSGAFHTPSASINIQRNSVSAKAGTGVAGLLSAAKVAPGTTPSTPTSATNARNQVIGNRPQTAGTAGQEKAAETVNHVERGAAAASSPVKPNLSASKAVSAETSKVAAAPEARKAVAASASPAKVTVAQQLVDRTDLSVSNRRASLKPVNLAAQPAAANSSITAKASSSPTSGGATPLQQSPKKDVFFKEEFQHQKASPEKRWTSDIDAVMKGRARSSSIIKKTSGISGLPTSGTNSTTSSAINSPTLPATVSLTPAEHELPHIPGIAPAKGLDLRKKAGSISGNDEAAVRQVQLWINRHLTPKKIENPLDQMSDGLLLIEVMEHISPGTFPKYNKRPILTAQKMDNLNLLLSTLKDKGIQVLCDADDLLKGDKYRTLSLILAVMRKYP